MKIKLTLVQQAQMESQHGLKAIFVEGYRHYGVAFTEEGVNQRLRDYIETGIIPDEIEKFCRDILAKRV